jgi:endoglucanase
MQIVFRVFYLFLSIALAAGLAMAAPAVTLKRGLPSDIWLTWPGDEEWSKPGFLDVFPEWRRSYGEKHLKAAKAAGFDFIRLAIDPAPFIANPSKERTAHLLAETKETIAEIEAAGLNVLVDLHAMPKLGRSVGIETYLADDASFAAYLGLVRQMATAIKDEDPARVAFEPINEPTVDCPWESNRKPRWPAMAQAMHAAARDAAPRLTLVISGACWGGAEGLVALDPKSFKDENIYWSFHSYEPFVVTHQGASWDEDVVRFIDGLTYPPDRTQKSRILKAAFTRIGKAPRDAAQKAEMKKRLKEALGAYFIPGRAAARMAKPFDLVTRWAKRSGIPQGQILLGEFGVIKKDQSTEVPEATRAAVMRATREMAERRGFAWSVWSWGGSFAITEEETERRFSPALLGALGLKGGP